MTKFAANVNTKRNAVLALIILVGAFLFALPESHTAFNRMLIGLVNS
jgi:hypothetical protein